MKKDYLKYYKKISSLALFRFFFDMLLEKKKIRRVALINRFKDYIKLINKNKKKLLDLHYRLNKIIYNSKIKKNLYDYGEGYFYQSFSSIFISGFRNTSERIKLMNLNKIVKNKTVLEIGCNSGFIACSIASNTKSVVAFDIMEDLIKLANEVKAYKNIKNIIFYKSSFEKLNIKKKFDVILSFANHSTYDNQTKQTLSQYFKKCFDLCNKNGYLLFESHPPVYEGENLKKAIFTIKKFFIIKKQKVLNYGSFLDRGRTFIVAQKKD